MQNISPSTFRKIFAVAVGITLLVLFFQMDWWSTKPPALSKGPHDTFRDPQIPNPYHSFYPQHPLPQNPPNAISRPPTYTLPLPPLATTPTSRYVSWDRRFIVPGPSPWKETCQYKEVHTQGLSFNMCLRAYDDIVSSTIRTHGHWGDCNILIPLWKMKSAAAPEIQNGDPEGIFVDAGANIGSCSLMMAASGIRTYGFEPSRANFFYLTSSGLANAPSLRDKLNMYLMGLGDTATTAPVYVAKGNAGNSQLQITSDTNVRDHQAQTFDTEEETQVAPLDEVMWPDPSQPPPHIRVMKMDVQGYEVKVLHGAKRLLQAGAIGILKTELAESFLVGKGTSSKELVTVLKNYNFMYLDNNQPQEINPDQSYPFESTFIRKQ